MAVDKVLEIDLTALTPASLKRVDDQISKIIESLEDSGGRAPAGKFKDPLLTPTSEKQSTISKIFGKQTFKNLLNIGSNPAGFFTSSIVKFIPFIGAALAVTGIFLAIITAIDNFQKEFVDRVDDRINVFRSKEDQARIQAGLTQLIITTSAGSAEPRDAYNTFNEFNTNQQRIETDFQIRDTSGVD